MGLMIALQQKVWVGGCMGRIAKMTDDQISVTGVYRYPNGGEESWCLLYKTNQFTADKWQKNGWLNAWNLEDCLLEETPV